MSQAVFLSYASQDAAAARRICEALRAAGLEVWFDQSELRGGDAWDQSIRKQIKECVLFVPVISENTNAREEGYFRLEWKLAVDRSHLMADSKAFLYPVLLDGCAEASAVVPDAFRARQWTRVSDAESVTAFAKRAAAIVSGSSADRHLAATPSSASTSAPATPLRPATRPSIVQKKSLVTGLIVAVLAVLALLYFRPWQTKGQAQDAVSARPQSGSAEAKVLVKQVEDLIRDPMTTTRENYVLADEMIQRVLKVDGNVAEYWLLAANVSLVMWSYNYDRTPERKQKAFEQTDRALKLSGGSAAAKAVKVRERVMFGSPAETARLADELLAVDPRNREALRSKLMVARESGDDAEADKFRARLRELPGGDPFIMLFDTLAFVRRGSLYRADQSLVELISVSPTRISHAMKLVFLTDCLLDPKGTVEYAASLPDSSSSGDAPTARVAMAYILMGKGMEANAVLQRVPRDYLEEYHVHMPKGLLAGLAHEVAGQSAAAKLEFRSALALVEKRLALAPKELPLLSNKAQLEAILGQSAAALETLRLLEELGGSDNPPPLHVSVRVLGRTGKLREAADYLEQQWPGASFMSRANLVRDLIYLPEYAALRKEKRVAAMILEHQDLVEKARKAPSARP